MSRSLALRVEAETDLEEASLWYEQQAERAEDFLAAVRATFARISERPGIYGRIHGETRRAAVRGYPYGVFFQFDEREVQVFAITHDRRDPAVWQRRAEN